MLFPNQFIPIFENSGFCKKLDLFMFEQACLQLRKWMDQGIAPIGISVNQSKLLFYEADYVDCLKQIVNKYQVSPQLLTLEILEDLVADNVMKSMIKFIYYIRLVLGFQWMILGVVILH